MPEPNFQIGTTGSYNPETGERTQTQFAYQPAPSLGPSPMDMLGNIAQKAYTTLPIKEAERATAAAIQFQGMRGYQQALKNGDPASKALAQWGPLMFYQKPQTIAPMIKATTPAAMTPYQQGMLDLAKQRAGAPKRLNVGGNLVGVNPDGTVKELYKGAEKSAGAISPSVAFRMTSDPMSLAILESTYGPEVVSNLVNIAKSGIKVPTVPGQSNTAQGAPATLKIGDVYKGYRWKGGDRSKKENWEKVQ